MEEVAGKAMLPGSARHCLYAETICGLIHHQHPTIGDLQPAVGVPPSFWVAVASLPELSKLAAAK